MEALQTTGVMFQINNSKLYVPAVTLSINDNIKFLENINQGFEKRMILQEIPLMSITCYL